MYLFEDVSFLDDVMEVGLHELEDQVQVLVVGSPVHVQQPNDVGVAAELFEKDNLPEGALGVSTVAEGVEDLLDGHRAARLAVRGLPDDPVGPLTQPPPDLVLLADVGVDVGGGAGHLKGIQRRQAD